MVEYSIGKLDELPEGKGIAVQAGRRTVAVFRFGNEVFAINNACPHKGASLCEGEVIVQDRVVRCPWHHWNWCVDRGHLQVDERQAIRNYEVVIEGDEVILRL